MPTRKQCICEATQLYEEIVPPAQHTLDTAWLRIFRILMWYEPVNWVGFNQLPHIIDSDKLRPGSVSKQLNWNRPNAWQSRAHSVSSYLAANFDCTIDVVPEFLDLLLKKPDYVGMQRQNILGTAFVGLLMHVLEKYGVPSITWNFEIDAPTLFPGISFPGRSSTPRIDLLASRDEIPLAIVSAKWSFRHDRLSDVTNECPVYKAAYERIFRTQSRSHLKYYFITNEFDPARLTKILDDPCVDGVIHVHKKAVTEICDLDGRLDDLVDLVDFVQSTFRW